MERTRVRTISAGDIESKIKCKKDLYEILDNHRKSEALTTSLTLHAIIWTHCNDNGLLKRHFEWEEKSNFLVLTQKIFDKQEIIAISVPKYTELSMRNVFREAINRYPNLIARLPVYPTDNPDNDIYPERDYFWNVFNTLHNNTVSDIIHQCYERRASGHGDKEEEKIEIRDDMLKAIQSAPFYASKLQWI